MYIRGGRLLSICSQFQTFLNLVRGGGQNFSIISEIQNILNYPSLIGNFSRFFLVMAPLTKQSQYILRRSDKQQRYIFLQITIQEQDHFKLNYLLMIENYSLDMLAT